MHLLLFPEQKEVELINKTDRINTNKRIGREKETISAMVEIYCREQHDTKAGICEDCRIFLKYATSRLDGCILAEQKPTCANCQIHCYQQDMREQAKQIMTFSGPLMLKRHPYLALRHLIDGRFKNRTEPNRQT